MPSDVTGSSIYNQRAGDFEFRPGPVFTNLLLGDEINRSPPKTQAALLEAMQERQVTIDGVTRPLERPFLVVATQNPIEFEGTYPLPEAQLDRFLLRLSVGYPSAEAEWRMLERRLERAADEVELAQVATSADVLAMQRAIEQVHVASSVGRYIVELVASDPGQPRVQVGSSPRGSLALLKVARAKAALAGRDFVTPEDVKAVAVAHPGPPAAPAARAVGAPGPDRGRGRRAARAGPDPAPGGRAGHPPAVTRRPSAKIAAYVGVAALALLAGLTLGRPELVAVAAPLAVLVVAGLAGRARPGAGRRGRRRPGTGPGRRPGHRDPDRAGRHAGSSGWRCCWSSPRAWRPAAGAPPGPGPRPSPWPPGRSGPWPSPSPAAAGAPTGWATSTCGPMTGSGCSPGSATWTGTPPSRCSPFPRPCGPWCRPAETLVSTGSHVAPQRGDGSSSPTCGRSCPATGPARSTGGPPPAAAA